MHEEPDQLVLRGVRVVDARGVCHESADVLLQAGRITAVASRDALMDRYPVLELVGATVVPGLINAHTHICLDSGPDPLRTLRDQGVIEAAIAAARRLEAVLRAGVTTIRDLGAPNHIDIELRKLVDRMALPGPRMLTAGKVITMTGGHGYWMGSEADGIDAVRRAVRREIKFGATTIKVMATGGVMTPGQVAGAPQLSVDEIAAASDEAHKAGLIVAAHAESAAGARNAILGGVDSIEHGHGMDSQTIELALEHGTVLVPTMLSDDATLTGGVEAGIPRYVVEKTRSIAESLAATLQLAIRAGVTVVAGNDGGTPLVDAADVVGELELYVEHGMSCQAALASSTSLAARLLRLDRVGLVEPSYHADLIVVDGDPLTDIRALRHPRVVVHNGRVVHLEGSEDAPGIPAQARRNLRNQTVSRATDANRQWMAGG